MEITLYLTLTLTIDKKTSLHNKSPILGRWVIREGGGTLIGSSFYIGYILAIIKVDKNGDIKNSVIKLLIILIILERT